MLKTEGIFKQFGGVMALENVNFDMNYSEIHALVGENGAGKTTLMNILGGIIKQDKGRIILKNKEVKFNTPLESLNTGIAVIHQELTMMPELNVIENVFMGRMKSINSRKIGFIKWKELENKTREALDIIDLKISPRTLVKNLSISEQQEIEIVKALVRDAYLIIMDEPNSSLSDKETNRLFEVIKKLKKTGVSIIYVSHKIEEVLKIADRITVLRDGHYVGTLKKKEATVDRVINLMVGRELKRAMEIEKHYKGDVLLSVRRLTGAKFYDISFDIKKGEIIGFYGLIGAGRSEVARAIFGADKIISGEIYLENRQIHFNSPRNAIENGFAMVPEDRKQLSLFMNLAILYNMSMSQLPKMSFLNFIINKRDEEQKSKKFAKILNIKLSSFDNKVSSLSGGNQQKVVLSRWLMTDPKLLILDEPTHGIDVGAKAEIYKLIRDLASEGISILLISSEMPEILSMSDQIVVMNEGHITGIFNKEEVDEERLMAYATGFIEN